MLRDIQAVALLSGTILGVGIFSLPFLLQVVGIVPMIILFLVLGALLLYLQREIGHLVAVSSGSHLIPGYIAMYLGPAGKFMSFFASLFSLLFAMVAYLIAGGVFLTDLFHGNIDASPVVWATGIFVLGGYFILRGARTVARAELLFLGFFILLFLFIIFFGAPSFEVNALPQAYGDNPFLAFGGILFALWGMSVVPELKRILGPDERRIKRVITIGFLFSLALTIVFTLLIAGISGAGTTEDGLTGLAGLVNSKVLSVLLVFGFVAVFTSYMSIGVTFRDALHYDFHIPWAASFIIAAVVPYALYLAGITSLISVISIVGIVFLATEGILLSSALIRFVGQRREHAHAFHQVLLTLIILALATGAGLALQDFFTSGI